MTDHLIEIMVQIKLCIKVEKLLVSLEQVYFTRLQCYFSDNWYGVEEVRNSTG